MPDETELLKITTKEISKKIKIDLKTKEKEADKGLLIIFKFLNTYSLVLNHFQSNETLSLTEFQEMINQTNQR